MATIRVTTTVEIVDNLNKPIVTLSLSETANPSGNPRYFATYTRGAIQSTEHGLAEMLIARYGDKPEPP